MRGVLTILLKNNIFYETRHTLGQTKFEYQNFIFGMEMHIQERKKMSNSFSQARPDLCKITEVGSRIPDEIKNVENN